MPNLKKTALITDLDNTLFDWVDLWYRCFSPMLDEIVRVGKIPRDTLIHEIKAVHERHGTSEYSFLIEEIPSIQPLLKDKPATAVFASAIEIYQTERREHLKLFPTVAETLLRIKGRGTLIVGYTESMGFYSNYRIRRLGLDGVFDYVFCPEDHLLPPGIDPEKLRQYPASHYDLRYTNQRFTPKGSKKPDAAVLNAIIGELGLSKQECVYIGDSLMKDIPMAQACEVEDVWAEYGQAHKRPEYKLLQDVTHWPAEEVEREQETRAKVHVHQTHTLSKSFSELLDIFHFSDSHRENVKLTDERKEQIIDVWKAIVEVQRHFNDIEMRIRSMFVTIVLALFASMGFLIDKKLSFPVGRIDIEFATVLPVIGAFGAALFYFIDRHWYHRLLVGSVKHAIDIEKQYRDELPELSLSDAIGKESPYVPRGWIIRLAAWFVVTEPKYKKDGKIHSDGKIELFYKSIGVGLLLVAALVGVMGGVKLHNPPIEIATPG